MWVWISLRAPYFWLCAKLCELHQMMIRKVLGTTSHEKWPLSFFFLLFTKLSLVWHTALRFLIVSSIYKDSPTQVLNSHIAAWPLSFFFLLFTMLSLVWHRTLRFLIVGVIYKGSPTQVLNHLIAVWPLSFSCYLLSYR